MHSEPLVSVIMPAYNAERYIDEAVQSVIQQTWQNWELIIVNDGSTDGTREYLDSLVDPRIRVIHQENMGVSVARNQALAIANGKYITLLDSDDVLPAKSIETRAQYLEANKGIDLVDGVLSYRDKSIEYEVKKYVPVYEGVLFPRIVMLDSSVFALPFFMFKSSLIKGIKFKKGMSHLEDILFFIQLAANKDVQYGCVGETVYLYRTGHQSAMANMSGIEEGYKILLHEITSARYLSGIKLLYLKLKVSKILLLSWFAVSEYKRGVVSSFNILTKAGYN